MSEHVAKLKALSEKKKKLIEEEKKIIEQRKKYISDLAEKHNLLSATDEMLEGIFSKAAREITNDSDLAKEWQAIGENFRKNAKAKKANKAKSSATQSKSAPD